MLRCLEVQQFALVEQLQLEFDEGLNLLTGETGSGKSILVDALSLLLGEKAHATMIRTGSEKAVVTGLFQLSEPAGLRSRLDAAGLNQAGDELVIKREIALSGKGRAFVNDQLVSVGFLKEIARYLADIHGQNEQQTLAQSDSQLAFVDTLADVDPLAAEVRVRHEAWQAVLQQMAFLRNSAQERLRNIDWLRFQLDEIDKVRLKDPEEDLSLAAEQALLANADRLFQVSNQAYAALYEDENSAAATLKQAQRQIEELRRMDPRCAALFDQLQSARIAVDDVALSMREYASHVEANPKRLEWIEGRLAEFQRLKRKYGNTVKEILAFRERAARDLTSLLASNENLAQLEKDRLTAAGRYREAAQRLSEKRKLAARVLEKTVAKELAQLAMQRCRFQVAFAEAGPESQADQGQPAPWETASGLDQVEFLLSPNAGEDLKPLVKIASGGEVSRIMLALKSVRTLDGCGKCLVFDEVDAGIGGQTADVVGQKLKRLSQKDQVICVTHLPQIASYADRHYLIEKRVERGRTLTRVALLQHEARVQEIARMISGERKTESVVKHAAEMLKASSR
ncbi:MAG: DNA repair protein RecN [Acidimicrobiia bacterium]|nr:DNA repair protein RecN [Acidimicrobiia bacterium]